jgi:hypothetical protein
MISIIECVGDPEYADFITDGDFSRLLFDSSEEALGWLVKHYSCGEFLLVGSVCEYITIKDKAISISSLK